MHQEIQRGSGLMNTNRAAIEYEKEAHASNLEQGEAMEKSMISMDHEIEKLRTELANAEKRARAGAAAAAAETPSPGYAAGFRNPEMRYGWSSYPDVYAMHQLHFRIYKELRMRLIQIIQLCMLFFLSFLSFNISIFLYFGERGADMLVDNKFAFVGGVNESVSDDQLRQVFSSYGQLVHVKIPVGKRCGFVQFVDRHCAREALRMLNGTQLCGQKIRLSWGCSSSSKLVRIF
ncbi:Polyadenylate-binding protein RBP45B [Camellia lanceoleosa]|uniref:Polyadenylate-binding protein RBP45B n=1 Tax=Camellia lanceoleosa TaxID=1840588 RepID=A0ACC0HVX4_9ERIC|nr:Polyadenylate-binding protein RBP45B [Camellia lanceoleosa]